MTAILEKTPAPTTTTTIATRIRDHAARTPDRVAMREKDFGVWQEVTWADYWDRVLDVGHALLALGVEPGDRVAVHSENRREWLYTDLATVGVRGITVGLYPTNPAPEVAYLLSDSGATIVVTLDADGQHLPEEMERLVKPIVDGEVAVAHGSRVLGEAERNHPAREAGIVFFNKLVSLITRTHVTDCSNGYRAVRADVLPTLVLRQEQFHTSEFMIEAIKRGIPAREVPVTVVSRLSGHSKKPAVVRYGMGFANAIVRTWLR